MTRLFVDNSGFMDVPSDTSPSLLPIDDTFVNREEFYSSPEGFILFSVHGAMAACIYSRL